MKKVKVLVLGAGSRGTTYASYALTRPHEMEVAGVAEPRDDVRMDFAARHNIEPGRVYRTWQEALKADKFADAVIVATQDSMHVQPFLAAMKKNYHVLVEKPMAPTEKECRLMVAAARKSGKICAVCHVLRYTPYFRKLKDIIDSGAIGEVVTLQHMEPVGYWHQAHSFVRGNWRKKSESSPMILAKSCHDMDILRWLVGKPCRKLASFGSLNHFKREKAPKGSTKRCLDGCKIEPDCPYSAIKIYMNMQNTGWPVGVITRDLSREGRMAALEKGPYGRCVYHCDNDVVDNQVAVMEFGGEVSASFSMPAFTLMKGRETYVGGSLGMISGNGEVLEVTTFAREQRTIHETRAKGFDAGSGHGGGDTGLMKDFVRAVRENDPKLLSSSVEVSLESHLMAFAAEKSRLTHRFVDIHI